MLGQRERLGVYDCSSASKQIFEVQMSTFLQRLWLGDRPEKLSEFDGDPAKTLAAKALRSVLLGTLGWGVLYLAVAVPFFVTRKAAAIVEWAVIFAVVLACIFLLRRGYVKLSGWTFLSAAWLILARLVVLSGGIASPALMSHIAVIVVSAWLLGRRVAIWLAALSLAFTLSLAILEIIGVGLRRSPVTPLGVWAIAATLVSFAILPLASVTKALADSASRAQRELEARRREEQVRAESEDRFRATFYQAAVGISHIGLDGEWLLFNDRYCQMLGYTPAELRQKTLMEITHPDDREAALVGRSWLVAGEICSHTMEKRYLRKDESIFWASLYRTLVRDRDGAPKYFIGVVEDISERKKAEAALRESEERFRNMADTAPVMIWASGLDKLCSFFNKPWLEFTGRTMEQELGNGWADGVHPYDLDRCLATYSSSFDARRPFQMEYRLRCANGEYRWVLDNGVPHYRDGAFVGYIGSCIDVTEQKLMAERLRSQQVQLVDAQRLARLGSWGRDIETGAIEYSDETFRILGIPQSSRPPTLSAFLDLVHPKDRERVQEAAAEVSSKMAPLELSYRITRPDGEVRFLRSIVEAIRDNRGAPVRTVGSMQDVTEQVMADQLLRQSEERLKSAERLAHVGYWQWDLGTGQLIWSEECLRIFGRSGNYKPTKTEFFQIVVPRDREVVERRVRQSVTEKVGSSMEFRIVRPDGELRTVISVSEVLMNDEGSPARVFGAVQDVTDLRRAQEQTIARQKLESLGTLANGIAHDFNNLLGGVLAQAELALSEVAAGLNPEEELRLIRDVALRGSEIVRELMVYAGKEGAAEALVDVSRIVSEMLELLKVSVSKHAVLETNLGQDLPFVRANAAQLRQIVMNLVTNASDAIGDRDGIIRVTTRSVKVGHHSLSGISGRLPDGDYLELEISDTGRGIPPETRAKIFDPFFTTKSAGHGLGLSIVDGIVRGLGGAIHLTSEPDKGTTFRILLRSAESTAGTDRDAASAVEELRSSSKIAAVVVVEDEAPLRQAVTKMLRKIGFDVLEAADGTSAINLIRANGSRIDAILLDVTIPGASSAEVIAEAATAQPAAKVILTSAYSQETLAPPINVSEVSGFIRKPFQLVDLVHMLRSVLSL
jgi:PAS domain S-box-containing protein